MPVLTGPLHKIVWGGSLAGSESWSCSIHATTTDALEIPFLGLEAALKTWMEGSSAGVSALARLEWIKANKVNPVNGKYLDPTGARTWFVAAPSNGAMLKGPTEVTYAVTLRTDASRGLAHAGRYFPPAGAAGSSGFDDDGRLSVALAGFAATANKDLLLAFAALGATAVVWSQKGQVYRNVTSVSVGRVPDAQRRRRRNLVEDYQSRPLV